MGKIQLLLQNFLKFTISYCFNKQRTAKRFKTSRNALVFVHSTNACGVLNTLSFKFNIFSSRNFQINGRNVFTIEYDCDSKEDTVRNSLDEEVLTVQYNNAGQITLFNPSTQHEQAHIDGMRIMYDSSGRLSKIAWGASTIVFEYDRSSRIISMSAAADGVDYLER